MANVPDPPPREVKLRYRALAYWRRFGGHRRSTRRASVARRLSIIDSTGARVSLVNSSSSGVVLTTRSRNTSRAKNSTARKTREPRAKRRHRLLAPLHERGGGCAAVSMLLCGCRVDLNAFDPGESSSFHWGVGFDESFQNSKAGARRRLSTGTKFRLGLCGLHVSSRANGSGFASSKGNWHLSSLDASAASFDSGFGCTVASPVACPPPLGLVPARAPTTRLQLRSRDGTNSGREFTYDSGSGGFGFTTSSTGVKRKAPSPPSSPSYPSYPSFTPTTPPSPFVNDFRPADTFKATRQRSRVSVGCNGWLLADDDPAILGWHRSSGNGGKPRVNPARLSQLAEAKSDSDGESERKRCRTSACVSGSTSGASSPCSTSSAKPPLAPRPLRSGSSSRASIVMLSNDGSVSSGSGGVALGWRASSPSGLAVMYRASSSTLPMAVRPSFPITPPLKVTPGDSTDPAPHSSRGSSPYASLADYPDYPDYEDFGGFFGDDGPPRKRRSTASSSSSGGLGFGNPPFQASMAPVAERESVHMRGSVSSRGRTSFSARLSASLRLTKSQSPKTMRKALSPGRRRRQTRRSRSRSGSSSNSSGSHGKRRFHLGSKVKTKKVARASRSSSTSTSPPPAGLTSSPSIVFIDCPP